MTTREDPIEAAVGALERGEVVALPTETVYGLAADASNPDAIERLFETTARRLGMSAATASEHPSTFCRPHQGHQLGLL